MALTPGHRCGNPHRCAPTFAPRPHSRAPRASTQGGKDFGATSLFCKWGAVAGGGWKCLEGQLSGQTQVDHPKDTDVAKWAHPIGSCNLPKMEHTNPSFSPSLSRSPSLPLSLALTRCTQSPTLRIPPHAYPVCNLTSPRVSWRRYPLQHKRPAGLAQAL